MKRFLSILFVCLLLCSAPTALASSPQTSAALDAAFATGSLQIAPKQLTTLSYAEVTWFSSSPDGSRLLGLTPDGGLCIGQPVSGQIQVVTPGSSNVADEYKNLSALLGRINNLAGSDDFATWSPDGRYIALKSWKTTMQMAQFFMDLFVIDTQNASLLHLATWPGNIRDAGSGAVIQACFSADSTKLYYTLYTSSAAYRCLTMSWDLTTGENTCLFDSGWEDGGVPFYCDLHDIGLTPAGNLVQIAETLVPGLQGLSVTSPAGQRTFYSLSAPGSASLIYSPRRLQVSSESGYALLTMQGGTSIYALSVFRPDEDLSAAESLLVIDPANTLAASIIPSDQFFNSDGSLTALGSEYLTIAQDGKSYSLNPDRALNILDAELSPDGRYALLLTCRSDQLGEGAALYLMNLNSLQLMPVTIDGHNIGSEFRLLSGSMARFQSGILWNSDNLLILSTSSGTEVCEFVLPDDFVMPDPTSDTQPTAAQTAAPSAQPTISAEPSAPKSANSYLGAWRHPENGSTLFLLENGTIVNQLSDGATAYPLRWAENGSQLSLWHVGAEDAPFPAELVDGALWLNGAAYVPVDEGSISSTEPFAMNWMQQSGSQTVYLNLNEDLTGTIGYSYLDLLVNNRSISYYVESGLVTILIEDDPDHPIVLRYNPESDQLVPESEPGSSFTRCGAGHDPLNTERTASYLGAWRHPDNGSTLFILENGAVVNQMSDNVTAFPLRWKFSDGHLILWHIGAEDQPLTADLVDGALWLNGASYIPLSAAEHPPMISEKYAFRWEKSVDGRTMYVQLNSDLTGTAGYSYLGMAEVEYEIFYSIENGLLPLRLMERPDELITLVYNPDADLLTSEIDQWNGLSRRSSQQAAADVGLTEPYLGIWQAAVQNADSTSALQTLHLLNDGLALLVTEGEAQEVQPLSWAVRGTTIALGNGSMIPENGQLHLIGRLDAAKRPIYFEKIESTGDLFTGSYHALYPSNENKWCHNTLHILPGGIVLAEFFEPQSGAQDVSMTTWTMDGASLAIEGQLLTPSGGSLINESGIAYDGQPTTFEPLPAENDFIGQWKINTAVITISPDGIGAIVSDTDTCNLSWTLEDGTIILQPEGSIPAIRAFLVDGSLTVAEGGSFFHARKID